jgi:crotonobetainyl-CoA:carnitine CoA-transferase CaiB-like acyl-CoA transferase
MRLVEESDVIIENNSVDLLDKLGIGWEQVHARNPRLVMVRLPGVGLTGPYRSYLGFGINFESLCGLTQLRGYEDMDVSEIDSVFHMDAASGAAGAFATVAALRERDRSGEGQLVEVSQCENMLNHIGEYLVEAAATGARHERLGNRHWRRAPQGVYRCQDAPEGAGGSDQVAAHGRDRWVAISVGDDQEWDGLRRAMGNPEWAADECFATAAGRRHHDDVDAGISAWTATLTHYDAFHRCQAEGVPAGPVLTESECYADPHLRARSMFRANGNEEVGTHEYPAHAWQWDGPALAWERVPPLGVDNEAIFREVLGMSEADLQALANDGHLSRDYLGPDGQRL